MKDKIEKISFNHISNDLDDISKKLYLESPDTWVDFTDKVGDEKLDEMVLFYASKFNYVSILKCALDNNLIDLNAPSKNRSFSSIKNHLLAVSKDYKSNDVYNFLTGNYDLSKNNIGEESINDSMEINCGEKNHNDYFPIFHCPHCNSNILKSGYKVYEEVNFAFSEDKNKCEVLSRKKYSKVFCNNCKKSIDNVTSDLLESICSIYNCKKCGKNLTEVGITEKVKLNFNDKDNKFTGKEKTYNCPSCDSKLNEYQIKYFNL